MNYDPKELVDDYLMHHGIEGQKWGVRHGPPYPLDRKASSGVNKEKNSQKNYDQIKKDSDSLIDKMQHWWKGDTEFTDVKQWNNFMSDETFKKVEKAARSGQGIKNPAGDISVNKNSILVFSGETEEDFIKIPRTEAGKKIFNSVVEKYPASEFNYSRPKFDSNKLKGFETQAEKSRREKAKQEARDRDPRVQRIIEESKSASLMDRMCHSAIAYEIVDNYLRNIM